MASIILENCEIILFDKEDKILKISANKKDFPGYSELNSNLKDIYKFITVEIIAIDNWRKISKQFKKEMGSDADSYGSC